MNALTQKLRSTPLIARVAPYIIFVALTALQGKFGEASKYWFYLAKTLVGVWLIWAMLPVVKEMRWTFSLEAVLVGVGVIVVSIALDSYYPKVPMATGTPCLGVSMAKCCRMRRSRAPASRCVLLPLHRKPCLSYNA